MDGSSGIAPVTPKGWFVFFLATFQVAFAVSGKGASDHRKKGLALFDQGDCDSAAGELLKAVASGDSSHALVLSLAQALECDHRLVDALSATYIDHKTDTTGRIDVLLYRAQLLRKLGIADEADKVEKEVGLEMASEPEASSAKTWTPGWGMSGSVGWVYDGISKVAADSARWISFESDGIFGDTAGLQSASDSFVVVGAQVPASATLSFYLYSDRHYLALEFPGQLVANTSLTNWLVASGGIQLMASSTWTRRFSTMLMLNTTRTWYPVAGASPTSRNSASGQISGSWAFAPVNTSLGSSFSSTWDNLNQFLGCTVSHSLGIGRELPWGINASGSGGFTWYFDDARRAYEGLHKTVIMVSGAKAYIANRDASLHFLDRAGNAMKNALPGNLSSGIVAGQWVDTGTFDYPISNNAGWRRWNGSLSLSQKPFKRVSWTASMDLARTAWNEPSELGYFSTDLISDLYNTTLYNNTVNTLFFYKDVNTGEEYWIRKPASTKLVPLLYERRRIDWTVTAALAAKVELTSWLDLNLGWTGVRNQSNLEHVLEGSSYTRNLWNASTTVSW